jgi:hypothetical protein
MSAKDVVFNLSASVVCPLSNNVEDALNKYDLMYYDYSYITAQSSSSPGVRPTGKHTQLV